MATATKTATIALIGNPNTGKSTLFNALCGVRQRVGNYPGVTVEMKVGQMESAGQTLSLVDLPGTYSLAPRSPDEMVAVDLLLGRRADLPQLDAVICIIDAANLERNLYLASQVFELRLPTVVALNMMDVANDRHLKIDLELLRRQLGVPVIAIQAHKKVGLAELKAAIAAALAPQHAGNETRFTPSQESPFPPAFCAEVDALAAKLAVGSTSAPLPRYLVERLLLDTGGYLERSGLLPSANAEVKAHLQAARERLAEAGCQVPAVEAISRYDWVARVLDGVVERPPHRAITLGDRIDGYLTHRLWGTLAFALLMLAIFQSVFAWAQPLMDWIDAGKELVAGWVGSDRFLADGALRSLLVSGVIEGVGSVVKFVPQIMILFFFIAMLEDCGYMARAAYLMDKLMSKVGLSGKSFIPLLSSLACAIPGVMATRVIENRRDRLTTMLVAPLMTCAARLPVYTLLCAAFLPPISYFGGLIKLSALVLFGLYLLGILAAVGVAFVLKRTLLRGSTPPFVMELPNYKWPSAGVVVHRMIDRGWDFIREAGTVILTVTILVWALGYFPRDVESVEGPHRAELARLTADLEKLPDAPEAADARDSLERQMREIDNDIAAEYQRRSWLGRMGQWIEPVVKPLGWDWRIGCAVIASFPAREVVVGTLGVIYSQGQGADPEEGGFQDALRRAKWDGTDRPVFNVPVALSIMVFFALCAQCASTLAVIKRETQSWRWPLFTFTYMTVLAYIAAFITYRVGMWFG